MKKLHILLFLALGSLVSCDKNNTDPDDAPVVIQNDIAQLSTRLDYDNSGLLQLSNLMASARFKSTTGATVAAIENPDFSLALVAQIAPPDYEGNKLRATHVAVSGNYAYVSYNTEGDKYLGGVDVIDISDINTPRLVVNTKLPNIDISSLAIDGDNLLLAGAADEGVLDNISSPAVLIVLPLQNGIPTTAYRYTALPSYVATDVAFNNESQYVVSGNSGAIARLSKTSGKIENTSSIPDLLAVKTYKNQVFALSGSQGIKVMNNNLSVVKTIETVLNPTSSKRTIDFYNDFLLIAEGSQGLGIYNTNTGAVQNRIAIPVSAEDNETDQEDIVTNAVTTNAARVFVANGGVSRYRCLSI